MKVTQTNGETFGAHGLEESISLKCSTTQSNLQIQCKPHENTNGIFHRTRKNNLKICMEPQKTSNSQSNLEEEEQS